MTNSGGPTFQLYYRAWHVLYDRFHAQLVGAIGLSELEGGIQTKCLRCFVRVKCLFRKKSTSSSPREPHALSLSLSLSPSILWLKLYWVEACWAFVQVFYTVFFWRIPAHWPHSFTLFLPTLSFPVAFEQKQARMLSRLLTKTAED
jgi:hypothetical protein